MKSKKYLSPHNQAPVSNNAKMALAIKQQKVHRTVVSPQQAPVISSRPANQSL